MHAYIIECQVTAGFLQNQLICHEYETSMQL